MDKLRWGHRSEIECRILMTNIADDTPSISSFHELVNSFMTEAVII